MSKIPCELVQDLLPNYIEKLTGEKSTELIRAHLETCEECRKMYQAMTGEGQEESAKESSGEKTEIDFLKKNRKRNRLVAVACVLGGLLLTAGILYSWFFLIGEKKNAEWIHCEVEVEGKHLTAKGWFFDSIHVVRKIHFSEKDGVVTMTPRSVLASAFHRGGFTAEYDAKEEIREVRMNGKTLYLQSENGKISSNLSEEILRHYEEWDKKNKAEQMLSSTLPGYCVKNFVSWEELTEYLGCEPENPFENADGFEKRNWTGADVVSMQTGLLEHAVLSFCGNRDGEVIYYGAEAGYEYNGVRIVYTIEPLGWNNRLEFTGEKYSYDNTVEAGAVISEDGEKTILQPGETIVTEYRRGENYSAADLYFITKGGIPCTVHVTALGEDEETRISQREEAEKAVLALIE